MKIARFSCKFLTRKQCFLIPVWMLLVLVSCRHSETQQIASSSLELTSSSFSGDVIPNQYSCDGNDTSPQLSWKLVPARTRSFALLVIDKDAPVGSFVHWLLYDIPAERHELPEGVPKQAELADGSRQGQNDFKKIGYGGPCPPAKSTHRYTFSIYALDAKLNLPPGATEKQIREAMNGHILAQGTIIGRFHH